MLKLSTGSKLNCFSLATVCDSLQGVTKTEALELSDMRVRAVETPIRLRYPFVVSTIL